MAGQSAWAIITISPTPKVRKKIKRIRKNLLKKEPLSISPGLGPAPVSPSLPSSQ